MLRIVVAIVMYPFLVIMHRAIFGLHTQLEALMLLVSVACLALIAVATRKHA